MDPQSLSKKGTPLLFEIKGNSLDDGPGIRTVVFFKGCPLNCIWCHNPEGRNAEVEISYDPPRCVNCGKCIDTCPEGALSRKNPHYIDRRCCTLCFACVEECPSGALARVGYRMSVQEVIKKIIIDKPFFDNSGGGVTLSGGEPTLYLEYAGDLTKNLKEQGVHVLLETCGLFKYDRFKEMLFPLLDAIYFDIKIHDSSDHMRFCGTPNSTILDNFIRILEDSRNGGPPLLPRTPLIPGITDTDANMHAIACFLKEHGVKKAELLPYNPLWHKKNWSIGCDDPLSDDTTMNKFMPRERIRRCRDIFVTMGIEV